MCSQVFIISGAILLVVCLYLFCLFRKEERLEFGIISKKISWINNIFHLLILFFLIGYITILYFVHNLEEVNSFILMISQILFWGAVFVLITIIMLKIMLENIVKAKLNQIDHLTLLNTKMAGNCKIDELLISSKTPIFLSILDLDNFKKLNDVYGHIIGDEVLVGVARIIKYHIREDEIACRFGGDEFVIGFNNRDEEEEVIAILDKIKNEIYIMAEKYPLSNFSASIGLTLGIGKGAGGQNTYKEMMLNADKALYHVKKNGKNAIHVYSEDKMH